MTIQFVRLTIEGDRRDSEVWRSSLIPEIILSSPSYDEDQKLFPLGIENTDVSVRFRLPLMSSCFLILRCIYFFFSPRVLFWQSFLSPVFQNYHIVIWYRSILIDYVRRWQIFSVWRIKPFWSGRYSEWYCKGVFPLRYLSLRLV